VRRERGARPVRVLIVSDRDIVRTGVAVVLRPYQDRVTVTGEGASVADALAEDGRATADLVIFDARLGGGDGLDEVDRVAKAWGDHRVVVLARPDEARFAQPVLQRGAAGFLLITIGGEELVEQIERVGDGAIVVDAGVAGAQRRLDDLEPRGQWAGAQLDLTEQQSKVLELVARGERTTMVACRLGMSEVEVKSHLRSAYRCLNVRDRPQALARLAQAGVFR